MVFSLSPVYQHTLQASYILCFVLDLSSKEAYEEALADLTDPLLPTRGHALFLLSKLLKFRNKYAMKDHKKLFDIFETNLAHHDTYLYLAAIEGLLFLVDVHHRDVLPLLCRKFAQFHDRGNLLIPCIIGSTFHCMLVCLYVCMSVLNYWAVLSINLNTCRNMHRVFSFNHKIWEDWWIGKGN